MRQDWPKAREGPGFHSYRGSKVSTLSVHSPPTHGGIELETVRAYTRPRKSKSFRIETRESFHLLEPLLIGKSVTLLLERPAIVGGKKTVSKPKATPVVIVPGELIGTRRSRYLVAVIGKGSTVVEATKDAKVANLVLAGIPSQLAKALMDQLHRITSRS